MFKKYRQINPFILCLLLFTGCRTKQHPISPEKKQTGQIVESVLEKVFNNSEKLNLEETLSSFDTSSNFFLISNGQRMNFSELKKVEAEYFVLLKKQEFNFTMKH